MNNFTFLDTFIDEYHQIANEYFNLGNYEKAFEIYKNLLHKNDPISHYNIGIFYYNGFYVEKDKAKSLEYLYKAYELEFYESAYLIAKIYFSKNTKEDLIIAIDYYNKYIDLSIKKDKINYAYLDLAYIYNNNEFLKNPSLAFKYLKLGADNNDSDCKYELACWYIKNFHFKDAKLILEELIKTNYKYAFFSLGLLYYKGEGCDKNYKNAYELFNESISFNVNDEMSFYYLANMYYKGYYINNNLEIALKYYNKSFSLGNKKAFIKLQNIITDLMNENSELFIKNNIDGIIKTIQQNKNKKRLFSDINKK